MLPSVSLRFIRRRRLSQICANRGGRPIVSLNRLTTALRHIGERRWRWGKDCGAFRLRELAYTSPPNRFLRALRIVSTLQQRTISREVSIAGPGLFSGEVATLTFAPAE